MKHRDEFLSIIWNTPELRHVLEIARDLDLPEWRIVAGALYNRIWNHLTARPAMHGIKDIDLIYFDPDTSWEAEDRVISAGTVAFPAEPPVEIRNQARVHLWYEDHFGIPYPKLTRADQAIDHYACLTHCVGLRLERDGRLDLYAPHGLEMIYQMRLVPNPILPNRETHARKGARQKTHWPELTIEPWPQSKEETA